MPDEGWAPLTSEALGCSALPVRDLRSRRLSSSFVSYSHRLRMRLSFAPSHSVVQLCASLRRPPPPPFERATCSE